MKWHFNLMLIHSVETLYYFTFTHLPLSHALDAWEIQAKYVFTALVLFSKTMETWKQNFLRQLISYL